MAATYFKPRLATSGTASYNGIVFDELIRSKASARPVYDDSGRVVQHVEHTFEIHAIISLSNSDRPDDLLPGFTQDTNAAMNALRTALTAPGKALHYDQKGYGSFIVNDPESESAVLDVKWGPAPELVSFVPLGAAYCAAVDFRVKTWIPECTGSAYKNKLMAASWDVTYRAGNDGLLTITTTGVIAIPLSMRGQTITATPDDADQYLDLISYPVPLGFQREVQRNLSADRSQLKFTFTDKQLAVAPPDGVVDMDLKHNLTNQNPVVTNGGIWVGRISGPVKVTPTAPKSSAWSAFVAFASERILYTIAYIASTGNVGAAVLPSKLEFEESMNGLDSRFSLTYNIFGGTLANILQASGLWQPVTSDWSTWRDSLANNAQDPRGVLQVRYYSDADTILDLCSTAKAMDPPYTGADKVEPESPYAGPTAPGFPTTPPSATDAFEPSSGTARRATLAPYGPDVAASNNPGSTVPFSPQSTWIDFNAVLTIEEDDHVVHHKPLAGYITVTPPAVDPTNLLAVNVLSTIDTAQITTDVPDIIQRLSSPSTKIILSGDAMRLGFPISPPRLATFQGQNVIQIEQQLSSNTVIGSMGGYPVVFRQWRIVYRCAKPATPNLPILANPLTQTNGTPGG